MMTDSDSLTGMPPGTYQIGETPETLEQNGKIHLPDGTIYGSGRLLLQDVFNLIDILNIPVPEAVAMASLNAARFLNVDDRLGSLKVGKQADFIVVDDQRRCRITVQKGVKVCDMNQRSSLVRKLVFFRSSLEIKLFPILIEQRAEIPYRHRLAEQVALA